MRSTTRNKKLLEQLQLQKLEEEIEKIQVEKSLNVNGLYRRFDIIIYDSNFDPYLLIECKSHKVTIDQSTFDQIANYNIAVRAPYLMVCNGVQTYCCQLDFETKNIAHLTYVPEYIYN